MIRIGISGTNWTGKTSTIGRFVREHPEVNVQVTSLSSLVAECPFPMGQIQTLDGSKWMLMQVQQLLCSPTFADIHIFDRSPLDIIAFTFHAAQRAHRDCTSLCAEAVSLLEYFQTIYYLPILPEWPTGSIVNLKLVDFARKIDSLMQRAIGDLAIEVTSMPWDMDLRQHLLISHLSEAVTA